MALFEKYPKDVRKIIALTVTAIVGIILVSTMIFIYVTKPKFLNKNDSKPSKISDFYNTILEKGQFIFGSK